MTRTGEHSEHLRSEMLTLNTEQTEYYDTAIADRGNLFTRIWSGVRNQIEFFRAAVGVDSDLHTLHWKWMGDLNHKSVLDLGCFAGNPLSIPIAKKSASYLGIDLSAPALDTLAKRLEKEGVKDAQVRVVDFLSPDFQEKFDVIYAHGVAHHFRHFDVFLNILSERLNPGGVVVTFDPLETSLPIRLARALYRPFQTDSAWEWPFDRKTFSIIEKVFDIEAVQGIMGYTKRVLPLAVINRKLAVRLGRGLHEKDRNRANKIGPDLWRCISVSMCLKKR